MYGHEAMDDPVCVESRTGYVILFESNCNLRLLYPLWKFLIIVKNYFPLWMELVSWVKTLVFLLAIPLFEFRSMNLSLESLSWLKLCHCNSHLEAGHTTLSLLDSRNYCETETT